MRLSRFVSVTFVAAVTAGATFLACGGDSKPNTPDSKVYMDAKVFMDAPPGGANALGQVCPFGSGGMGSACPAGNDCVTLTGIGSTTTGYCTPNCMGSNGICSTGYTGPAGGMPVCALSVGSGSGATGCAIVCTDNTQCPTGLTCQQVPQQQVKICAAP